jgi:hypothetical protein
VERDVPQVTVVVPLVKVAEMTHAERAARVMVAEEGLTHVQMVAVLASTPGLNLYDDQLADDRAVCEGLLFAVRTLSEAGWKRALWYARRALSGGLTETERAYVASVSAAVTRMFGTRPSLPAPAAPALATVAR